MMLILITKTFHSDKQDLEKKIEDADKKRNLKLVATQKLQRLKARYLVIIIR